MIECRNCGEAKPEERFDRDRKGSTGRKHQCRDCVNEKRRSRWAAGLRPPSATSPEVHARYRRTHPDRILNAQRKHRYGITNDDFEALSAAQDGRCAICGQKTERLQVDHDHQTGAVRGLLCGNCNKAIGLLEDDVERAVGAARYLGGNP